MGGIEVVIIIKRVPVPRRIVTVIQKADAQRLTIGEVTDRMREAQRIQLQQEQLRYMQSLRTGKPAGGKSSGHLLSRFIRWLV